MSKTAELTDREKSRIRRELSVRLSVSSIGDALPCLHGLKYHALFCPCDRTCDTEQDRYNSTERAYILEYLRDQEAKQGESDKYELIKEKGTCCVHAWCPQVTPYHRVCFVLLLLSQPVPAANAETQSRRHPLFLDLGQRVWIR